MLGKSQCQSCPIGWKRGDEDDDLSKCIQCARGETTEISGATMCSKCSIGESGIDKGICARCTNNTYQNEKGKDHCLPCEDGYKPNEGHTGCIKPDHLVASDCDYTMQYFNDSDSNPFNHTCAPCPLGASCIGPEITWQNVRAKYGWWRMHSNGLSPNQPPSCLSDNQDVTQPACAFERCLYLDACFGAKNEVLKQMDDRNETCDEENGYRNNCTDNDNNKVRCRLCATCKEGWKRTGSGTRCKECPPSATNKLMLGVGLCVMLIGSAVLVYMTIKAEGGQEDLSDAIKKILLNTLHMVSLAAGLPLQWPPVVENMLETFATMSTAGTTLLVPDCELTHLRTANAFYLKQIGFTILPLLIVIVCIIVWQIIGLCWSRRLHRTDVKNYTILTMVLGLFLMYPLLVKACFSMLKCHQVGKHRYLISDLEEPCIGSEGSERHLQYVLLLTVPQFLLCKCACIDDGCFQLYFPSSHCFVFVLV
jgi:hypothetical protein